MRLALSDALGSARLPTLTPDGALTSTHRNRTDHPKVFPGFLPESRTRRLARLRRLEPKAALCGVSESRSGESPAKTLFFPNRDQKNNRMGGCKRVFATTVFKRIRNVQFWWPLRSRPTSRECGSTPLGSCSSSCPCSAVSGRGHTTFSMRAAKVIQSDHNAPSVKC